MASHPSTDWHEVPCVTAPPIPYLPIVGNGSDYSAVAPDNISAVEGSLPRLSGATIVRDSLTGGVDDFSIQINTNRFATATCSGAKVPQLCKGWQQFVFSNPGGLGPLFDFQSSSAFMQYWLINYGNPCPSNWLSSEDSCYMNSQAVTANNLHLPQISDLSITGATANGIDSITWALRGSDSASAIGGDAVLGLAGQWTNAEFNIFGQGRGSTAVFNPGATVAVQMNVTRFSGATASPSCDLSGTTGEMNTLSLIAGSCCSTGGVTPAILFMESNDPTVPAPFCLLNDITPMQFFLQ